MLLVLLLSPTAFLDPCPVPMVEMRVAVPVKGGTSLILSSVTHSKVVNVVL